MYEGIPGELIFNLPIAWNKACSLIQDNSCFILKCVIALFVKVLFTTFAFLNTYVVRTFQFPP